MKIRIPHGRRALTGGALALLALGGVGAVTAAASSASTPSHPSISHNKLAPSDTDNVNVQQGDQSGPDTGTATTEAKDSGPDTDNVNVQQGDQSGPDTGTAGSDSGN